MKIGNHGHIWNGNCLELMKRIPTGKVDMILCDLPYGTTDCKWDSIIPFEPLWAEYKRVCKPNAAIALTAAQPFTSALIASNYKMFKYCWYWIKNNKTSYASAKHQPMRNVEEVCIFYKQAPKYNPQGIMKIPAHLVQTKERIGKDGTVYAGQGIGGSLVGKYTSEHTNYPHQTLMFAKESGLHPTQKPLELFAYLIRTYTDKGQVVLDNTCGSGTTGVAAMEAERKFICIEMDEKNYATARDRLLNFKRGFGV